MNWPVKAWLHKRGIFVYSVNWRLGADTTEHWFHSCEDAIFLGTCWVRTLNKKYLNSRYVRYLIAPDGPFDMFLLMGVQSLRKTRMLNHNAEPVVSLSLSHSTDVIEGSAATPLSAIWKSDAMLCCLPMNNPEVKESKWSQWWNAKSRTGKKWNI